MKHRTTKNIIQMNKTKTMINPQKLIKGIQMRQAGSINNKSHLFLQSSSLQSSIQNNHLNCSLNLNDSIHNQTLNIFSNYLIHNKSIEEMSKSTYISNDQKTDLKQNLEIGSSKDNFSNLNLSSQNFIVNQKLKMKFNRQDSMKNNFNSKRKKKQKQILDNKIAFNDTLIKKASNYSIEKNNKLLPEIKKFIQVEQDSHKNIKKQKKKIELNFFTIDYLQNPEQKLQKKKNIIIDFLQKKQIYKRNQIQKHLQKEKNKLFKKSFNKKNNNQIILNYNILSQRPYQSLEISPKQNNQPIKQIKQPQQISIKTGKRYKPSHKNFYSLKKDKKNQFYRISYSPWHSFRQQKDGWELNS